MRGLGASRAHLMPACLPAFCKIKLAAVLGDRRPPILFFSHFIFALLKIYVFFIISLRCAKHKVLAPARIRPDAEAVRVPGAAPDRLAAVCTHVWFKLYYFMVVSGSSSHSLQSSLSYFLVSGNSCRFMGAHVSPLVWVSGIGSPWQGRGGPAGTCSGRLLRRLLSTQTP